MLSHSPDNSSPEWFDASTDQWQHCICENCQCKSYKTVLAPPHYLCTCTLLDDGRLIAIGGSGNGNAVPWVCYFDTKLKSWLPLPKMMYQRIKPYVVQIGSEIYVVFNICIFLLILYIACFLFYYILLPFNSVFKDTKICISIIEIVAYMVLSIWI